MAKSDKAIYSKLYHIYIYIWSAKCTFLFSILISNQ